MRFDPSDVVRAVSPLIGLRVVRVYYAGDTRGFLLRACAEAEKIPLPEWCLHVACPWRLEHGGEIVTGAYDWLRHATREDILSDEWDPTEGGSLQEYILRSLLSDSPGKDRTIQNNSALLRVVGVEADQFGGFTLVFESDYRLVAFPSATRGEQWRVFLRSPDAPHFVLELNSRNE